MRGCGGVRVAKGERGTPILLGGPRALRAFYLSLTMLTLDQLKLYIYTMDRDSGLRRIPAPAAVDAGGGQPVGEPDTARDGLWVA